MSVFFNTSQNINLIKNSIRNINDFPKKNIIFRDIMPLIGNKEVFKACIKNMKNLILENTGNNFDYIACCEARGFMFGPTIAMEMSKGAIPVRKKGKLPPPVKERSYKLEYGTDTVVVSPLSFNKGDKIVLFDDVLATGNTALASLKLLESLGAKIVGTYFLMGLNELPEGKNLLKKYNPHALFYI